MQRQAVLTKDPKLMCFVLMKYLGGIGGVIKEESIPLRKTARISVVSNIIRNSYTAWYNEMIRFN